MSISSAIASAGLRRFHSTVDMEFKEKLIENEEVYQITITSNLVVTYLHLM